jgi:hypothetical protein
MRTIAFRCQAVTTEGVNVASMPASSYIRPTTRCILADLLHVVPTSMHGMMIATHGHASAATVAPQISRAA